jgi:hypothetical protein
MWNCEYTNLPVRVRGTGVGVQGVLMRSGKQRLRAAAVQWLRTFGELKIA